MGVIAASEPPQIMTSASPREITRNASPTACAPEEHAVQGAEFGPRAPKRIDTWPAARLMMLDGIKNGEIFRGPPSSSAVCSRSMTVNPPMPEPMKTPARSGQIRVNGQAGLLHREVRRSDGVVDEEIHLLEIFLVEPLEADRNPSLRRQSAWKTASRQIVLIGPTPLRPSQQALPCFLGSGSQRGHQSHAGDYNSSFLQN